MENLMSRSSEVSGGRGSFKQQDLLRLSASKRIRDDGSASRNYRLLLWIRVFGKSILSHQPFLLLYSLLLIVNRCTLKCTHTKTCLINSKCSTRSGNSASNNDRNVSSTSMIYAWRFSRKANFLTSLTFCHYIDVHKYFHALMAVPFSSFFLKERVKKNCLPDDMARGAQALINGCRAPPIQIS